METKFNYKYSNDDSCITNIEQSRNKIQGNI